MDGAFHKTYRDNKKGKIVFLVVRDKYASNVAAHPEQVLEQLFVRLRVLCQQVQEADDVSEVNPELWALLVQFADCL